MKQKSLRLPCGMAVMLLFHLQASGQTSNFFHLVTDSARVSTTAAGGSFAPSFSADGRSLMFLSRANNLVTNDNNWPWLDLFVHRLETGQTILASPNQAGTGGSEADVESPSISSNGNRVAFVSFANDMTAPAGAINQEKVFVRDLPGEQTRMVNLGYSNQFIKTRRSRTPTISQDGHFVFFQSPVSGLETNGPLTENASYNYIYARDLQSNLIQYVSQSTNISEVINQYAATPSITPDGHLIAFLGYTEMASTYPNRREIYVRDMEANTTTCISRLIARIWPEWESVSNRFHSFQPKITPDGRYVVFSTLCQKGEIWHYDRLADRIALVVTNVPVTLYSDDSDNPTPQILLSDNGQIVIYDNSTNLFAWDARTSSNQVVDVSLDGVTPGNGISAHAALSSDGSKIVFVSNSTNLVQQTAVLTNGWHQIYLRDLTLGTTYLLSTNAIGQFNGDYSACYPVLSPGGTLAAFDSTDDSLVENDFNHDSDVFTKNLLTGELRLISRAMEGTSSATALGSVYGPTISVSRDGRYVAFTATDGELVLGDTNGFRDAIVSDQQTGVKTIASVGANGVPGNLDVVDATVSDDGRFVLFSSFSANLFSRLPPTVIPGVSFYYLRDLQTSKTLLVTSNDSLSAPVLSPDGRYVAFTSAATNLVDYVAITNGLNYTNLYLYDIQARTNILVSFDPARQDGGLGYSCAPRFSPNSLWLAFDSYAPNLDLNYPNVDPHYVYHLYLFNVTSRSNRYLFSTLLGVIPYAVVFSANSEFVAFNERTRITVHDIEWNTNRLASWGDIFRFNINENGTQVTWLDHNSLNRNILSIVSMDMTNRIRVEVTTNLTGILYRKHLPQIAPDGQHVIFHSYNRLLPIDTNGVTDVYLFDVQQSNLVMLASTTSMPSGNNGSLLPTLSPDGRILLFQSFAPDLAANDFNGSGDWLAMQISSNLVESIARPTITGQPTSQINVDGAMMELNVTVASGANVYYQWWKDGVSLTNDGRRTGADTAVLRFSSLVAGDSGGYSVVVSNVYGCQTSMAATLTIIHPPFALLSPAMSNGVFTFGMQSYPGRTYQLLARPDLTQSTWQPEGLPISATGEVLWFNLDLGTNRQRYLRIQAEQ